MKITTKRKRTGLMLLDRKARGKATKEALQVMAVHWFTTMFKRHFWPSAVARYGYEPRTDATETRKRKGGQTPRPLVQTGRLRRMSTRRATISGSSKSARVTLTIPAYLREEQRRELTIVTPQELTKLGKVFSRALQKEIDRHRGPTKTEVLG